MATTATHASAIIPVGLVGVSLGFSDVVGTHARARPSRASRKEGQPTFDNARSCAKGAPNGTDEAGGARNETVKGGAPNGTDKAGGARNETVKGGAPNATANGAPSGTGKAPS